MSRTLTKRGCGAQITLYFRLLSEFPKDFRRLSRKSGPLAAGPGEGPAAADDITAVYGPFARPSTPP
jgi:hypothetical protein